MVGDKAISDMNEAIGQVSAAVMRLENEAIPKVKRWAFWAALTGSFLAHGGELGLRSLTGCTPTARARVENVTQLALTDEQRACVIAGHAAAAVPDPVAHAELDAALLAACGVGQGAGDALLAALHAADQWAAARTLEGLDAGRLQQAAPFDAGGDHR